MNKIKKILLTICLLLVFVPYVSKADVPDVPAIFEDKPAKIIGADNRVKITNATTFPYNTIVHLEMLAVNGVKYTGTGTIIAPNVVLTAGHCVFDYETGEYYKSIAIRRTASTGNLNEIVVARSTKLLAHPDFVSYAKSHPGVYNSQNDIGLIFLNQNTGLSTGWMGLSTSSAAGQFINITGFPGDHLGQLWGMGGNILRKNGNMLTYNIDMMGGQSGSPIYTAENYILGVNVSEAYSSYVLENYGVALTSNYLNWIQANVPSLKPTTMSRLYNRVNKEHLYTKSMNEVMTLVRGDWNYEGVCFNAPASGNPVYRLYHPSGEHHYTMDANERNVLVKSGWKNEGIGWYSDPNKKVPMYRLYNAAAGAGAHHYTASVIERDTLAKNGWKLEGIGWYGI